MIIKIFKNIHSKYSNIFKFFFYLKYLLVIFLSAIFLFLVIPKFLNYDEKLIKIKEYLIKNYNFQINSIGLVEYKIFPSPHLSIKEAKLSFENKPIFMNSKEINIFLNFKSIYNYENLMLRKIVLHKAKVELESGKIKDFISSFTNFKKKIDFKNLNIILNSGGKTISRIEKIQFSNYGYRKNNISGEVFNKRFELDIDNTKLSFRIKNTGINISILLNEKFTKNNFSGSSTVNILNNYLKMNFQGDFKQIKIKNSKFRNKNLSTNFELLMISQPFFEIDTIFVINKINKNLLSNINFEKIIQNKEIIKKINGRSSIIFKRKNTFNKIINNFSSEISFVFGRINYLSTVNLKEGKITCKGSTPLVEQYPRLSFNCLINADDKSKFLNQFSIKKKLDNNKLSINLVGSLNLLNRKINFQKIKFEKNHFANEEDIQFFKEAFERNLFNENFLKIFVRDKIENFIKELI